MKQQKGFLLASEQAGFSLIDTLVVLGILAILGFFATLEYRTTELSFERMNARSFIIQDLKRAQAEAITWGCRGIMTISANGNSYSYGCDFLEYDTNEPPQADQIFFTRILPGKISLSSSEQIIFNSRGHAVDTDANMINVTISLTDKADPASPVYITGTLLGTGVFSYDS